MRDFFENVDFAIVIPVILGIIVVALVIVAVVLNAMGQTTEGTTTTALDVFRISDYFQHLNNF